MQIVISEHGGILAFDAEAPVFVEGGCYSPDHGFTWTDGLFSLPDGLFATFCGPVKLLIQISDLGVRYPI